VIDERDLVPSRRRRKIEPKALVIDVDGDEVARAPSPAFETFVTVIDPRGARHDVVIEAREESTGAQLTAALSAAFGGSAVTSARHGRLIAAGERLGSGVVRHGDVLLMGNSPAAAQPKTAADRLERRGSTLLFNRAPRVVTPIPEQAIRVPAPPTPPHRTRLPLLTSLLPIVIVVPIALLIGQLYLLAFMLLSPLMAIGTWLSDRRAGRIDQREGTGRYRRQLADIERRLADAYAHETEARHHAAPDPFTLVGRAVRCEPELWERRPESDDFLSLRVGLAPQPSRTTATLESGGSDELRNEAGAIIDRYSWLDSVPILANVREHGAVGVCGELHAVTVLSRWLAVQAAVLHSPADVVIAAVVSPGRAAAWDWLKWLPHTGPGGVGLERRIAVGPAEGRELFEDLAALAERRRAESARSGWDGDKGVTPFVLVMVDGDAAPDRALVTRVLAGRGRDGIGAIWLGARRRDLPGECGAVVELSGRSAADVITAASGAPVTGVKLDEVTDDEAEWVARALAPLRDVAAGSRDAVVPTHAPLLELLGFTGPTAAEVERRWSRGLAGVVAELGGARDGTFHVDLTRDGPHALVAGTTGAGKSELLQSLVAGLAATYPPSRLSFLLVDYKGGSAFDACAALPHTVGMVTDLDGNLPRRALTSLEAELRRREEILRAEGAKDLLDMERRAPARAPAKLLIVIDEFAALVREVPEFVDGVLDVAQRGRSLGVHLVLATQHPSGVVSESIRANMNLRIALRVATPADSQDVIGAPDAARISRTRPGRAFARTGDDELTEFQAAYVGGTSGGVSHSTDVALRPLRLSGDGEDVRLRSPASVGVESDLSLLVNAIQEATERTRVPLPPPPWVRELPELVPYAALLEGAVVRRRGGPVAIGVIDEPARQRRSLLTLDLERDGSVAIFGASGSGKTALLRTIAVALAESAPPDRLHLYGLDFAHGGLRGLEALPHCGSVVSGEDAERVARVIARLRRTIEERGELFARNGVFSLAEYDREVTAGGALPRVVLLLDSYAGFVDAYEMVDGGALVDALPRIVADGRALGVHVVLTADRRGAVPPGLMATISRRLVLRMANEDEYATLGLDVRTVRDAILPPGRGFTADGLEFHAALLGDQPSGEAQSRELARIAADLRERSRGRQAPPIGALPTRIRRGELSHVGRHPLAVPLGLDDVDLQTVVVELADEHFLALGPYRSGRSTVLATIARSLRDADPDLDLHLIAPRRSPLPELGIWTSVARGFDEAEQAARRFADEAAARDMDADERCVVVIDDGGELADGAGAIALEQLVRRGRDVGVRVVAAAEVNSARGYCPWLRELRKEGHGVLLDPDLAVDGDLLSVQLPRRSNAVFPPGRGYLVRAGRALLIQVATD
jgi:S-DNA-T family DNA segregation ATPase FtsK/SpoIIIE